eukprot:TRINITY_DN3950_c0_g1_i2.p1 TRINITY_DN3950_c0_g1~~TRINITY_DN3950_c0_g1_i2.p1  ORF type:complete len:481 (-),score=108.88 TRINITY_DN3950_c0_g1_i2:40-1482(-)
MSDSSDVAAIDWGRIRKRLCSPERLILSNFLGSSCDFLFKPVDSSAHDEVPPPPPPPQSDEPLRRQYVSRYLTKDRRSGYWRVVVGPEHCIISDYFNVRVLDLSHNDIRLLPAEIGRLANLQELNVSHNAELSRFPPEIGRLAKLQSLHFNETAVMELPIECYNLVMLADVRPAACLRFPPSEVVAKGCGALHEFLRQAVTPGHRVASAECCEAWGPGLHPGNVAGDTATFTIQARDREHQKLIKGGDHFRVTVRKDGVALSEFGVVDCHVSDGDDGTYSVAYKVPETGTFLVAVKLHDHPIPGSPFNVVFDQAEDLVYQFGATLGMPQLLPRPYTVTDRAAGNIIQVACGPVHTLLLTDLGLVWALGSSQYGQCGGLQELSAPKHLASLRDIVQVACGPFNSLAVDSSGNVFSWGAGHESAVVEPRQVHELSRHKVRRVASIAGHNVAITVAGALWVWRRRPAGRSPSTVHASHYAPQL